MKKTFIAFLGSLLLLLAAPAMVQAQFYFGVNAYNTNTITITGYYGTGGAVTIPNKISNLLVTSIGGGKLLQISKP